MTTCSDGPISPPPLRELRPDVPPAYLSNGLIGLRVGCVPLHDGLAMVQRLVGRHPVMQVEAFARAPYPAAGDVAIDGHRLSAVPGRAAFVEQRYDFSAGELTTRFAYRVGEAQADVETLTLCSRTSPTLVLQEQRVTVSRPCRLTMSAGLGTTGIAGRCLRRATRTPESSEPVVDGYLCWEAYGGLTTCGAAYVTELQSGDRARRTVKEDDELAPLATDYVLDARPGRRYVLRQLASVVPSQLHGQPELQALRLAAMGRMVGFENLRDETRRAWADIWASRIRLLGAGERWQAIADASFYYLQASAHASSLFSTAMFGLAYWPNYHYYRGHVMWDVEAFAFPVLLLTAGLYAARLGDRALSANLFEEGYAELIDEPYLTVNEFSSPRFPDKPRFGPLFANLGGFLSACAVGLPGLRISHDDPLTWPERRVVMPEGWDGVEVDRIWLRGRPARLRACHGDERAAIEYLD